ncbi:hypothetical protein F4780DRAFT_540850 [Xylariomycetidae sp. FL0641]|nr:hypothetical protein F4780DRAFT_540850 [Xylariomycetidae sp. FL0641]
MASTKQDIQVSSLAFGFTLGFGFLTVWEAIKQTRRNKDPVRSAFIYMIWGEILSNLGIGILGYLFLDEVVGPTVPVLFIFLFFYVFEIQLILQLIINRVAVISENRDRVNRIKWGVVAFIGLVQVAVFCIFIPGHLVPPPVPLLAKINTYWDPASKIIICLVDASLNWWFLRVVKQRLVNEHGLTKYQPLVSFNAKLLIVSVGMDALLIGLMWLPNETVFIQFHPVVYTVKLNIEMTMANLILRLARRGKADAYEHWLSYSNNKNASSADPHHGHHHERDVALKSFNRATVKANPLDSDSENGMEPDSGGINRTIDYHVSISANPDHTRNLGAHIPRSPKKSFHSADDEISLANNAGHP